jgi:hypothetical protein
VAKNRAISDLVRKRPINDLVKIAPRFYFPPHIPCDTVSRGGTSRPVTPHAFSAPHLILGGPPTTQAERHQTHLEVRTHILAFGWQKRGLGEKQSISGLVKNIDFSALGQYVPKSSSQHR